MISANPWTVSRSGAGCDPLDPLIAVLVAVNILRTGLGLLRQAGKGLMDASLPASEVQVVRDILKPYDTQGVEFHALRTRSAAARGFVSVHILVPGAWSVQRAHQLAEQIETEIRQGLHKIVVFTHVEPLEDPLSWADETLEHE